MRQQQRSGGVKKWLRDRVESVEESLGLSSYTEEKNYDRCLDLVAEADALRAEAEAAKIAGVLTPGEERDIREATAAVSQYKRENFEWAAAVPVAQERKAEQALRRKTQQARKAEQRAREEDLLNFANDASRAAGTAAVATALSSIAAVAASVGEGLGFGKMKELPGDEVPAEARQPAAGGSPHAEKQPPRGPAAPFIKLRRMVGLTEGAASGLASWAQSAAEKQKAQAAADTQWLRLAGCEKELTLLGLTMSVPAQTPIQDAELREAWRAISRKLHPDVVGPGDDMKLGQEGRADIYAVNAAYEKLRKLL